MTGYLEPPKHYRQDEAGDMVRQLPPFIPRRFHEEEDVSDVEDLVPRTVQVTPEVLDAMARPGVMSDKDFTEMARQLSVKEIDALAGHPYLSEERMEILADIRQDIICDMA